MVAMVVFIIGCKLQQNKTFSKEILMDIELPDSSIGDNQQDLINKNKPLTCHHAVN